MMCLCWLLPACNSQRTGKIIKSVPHNQNSLLIQLLLLIHRAEVSFHYQNPHTSQASRQSEKPWRTKGQIRQHRDEATCSILRCESSCDTRLFLLPHGTDTSLWMGEALFRNYPFLSVWLWYHCWRSVEHGINFATVAKIS